MRTILRTAGPYLWRYRRGWAIGMGALLIKDLLGAALPLTIRNGVDSLAQGFSLKLVFEFAALLIALSLAKAAGAVRSIVAPCRIWATVGVLTVVDAA